MVSQFYGPLTSELDIARRNAAASVFEPLAAEHGLTVPDVWQEPFAAVAEEGPEGVQLAYLDLIGDITASRVRQDWDPGLFVTQIYGVGIRKAREVLSDEAARKELLFTELLRRTRSAPMRLTGIYNRQDRDHGLRLVRQGLMDVLPSSTASLEENGMAFGSKETVRFFGWQQLIQDSTRLSDIITSRRHRAYRRLGDLAGSSVDPMDDIDS